MYSMKFKVKCGYSDTRVDPALSGDVNVHVVRTGLILKIAQVPAATFNQVGFAFV